MDGEQQIDGVEDPFQQDFFTSLNQANQQKGDVTLQDLRSNSAADLQSAKLPLQKKDQNTANGKAVKLYRNRKIDV